MASITVSPFLMPIDFKKLATLSLMRFMSAKVMIFSAPLSSHHIRASLSGVSPGNGIHDIVGKIEVRGHLYLEIIPEILI